MVKKRKVQDILLYRFGSGYLSNLEVVMTSIVLKKAPKRLENLKTENRAGVSSTPRGGVSPRLNMPAARGLKGLTEQRAGAVPAAAFPNFSFHGGPVISSPQVYSSFWGNQ